MNSVARGTLSLAGTKKFMLYKNRFSDSILDVNLHRNHCKKTTTNCFIRWTSAIYNQSHWSVTTLITQNYAEKNGPLSVPMIDVTFIFYKIIFQSFFHDFHGKFVRIFRREIRGKIEEYTYTLDVRMTSSYNLTV